MRLFVMEVALRFVFLICTQSYELTDWEVKQMLDVNKRFSEILETQLWNLMATTFKCG